MTRDPVFEWATSNGASPASLAGDAVSEVLDQLRIESWFAGRSRLSDPFGVEIPVAGGGMIAICSGSLIFELDRGEVRFDLQEGDLLIVLRGERFTLKTSEHSATNLITEMLEPGQMRTHRGFQTQGPQAVEHIGAAIRFTGPHDAFVRNMLPPVLRVRWDKDGDTSLSHCVRWLSNDARVERPGDRASINRHIALIVVEAIKQHLDSTPPTMGYLRALNDPYIGPVLGLMRSRLGHDWSVESLALESGLSRSGFHARFMAILGVSPASHLRELRMHAAKDLLRSTDQSIREIGCGVGYGSDTAFGAAFKRSFGISPSAYRQQAKPAAKAGIKAD
ncbi:MAG: cupin domain-containing protein [Phycisphaerales bacterium JB052]